MGITWTILIGFVVRLLACRVAIRAGAIILLVLYRVLMRGRST